MSDQVILTGAKSRPLADGDPVRIPPGQFSLMYTHEAVHVPPNAIAFVSMKAKKKLEGLVNISGFHVDPGFHGRLKFSVYNAGTSPVFLEVGQPLFLIWFADLDRSTADIYHGEIAGARSSGVLR